MTAQTSELEALTRAPRTIAFAGGQTFEIRPIPVGRYQALIREAAPFLPDLVEASEAPEKFDWFRLIGMHGDSVVGAVAVASAIDRATVAGLLPDEFVELASMVVEINADFFVSRMVAIRAATARIREVRARVAADGLTSSSGSSPEGTAATT